MLLIKIEMSEDADFYKFAEFLRTQCPLRSSVSSERSEISPQLSWNSQSTTGNSSSKKVSLVTEYASDVLTEVNLTYPVTLSFIRGRKLFKLKYSKVAIYRDITGNLKCIELSDPSFVSGAFIHTFPAVKRPLPHLEQPATSSEKSLRVTFLEKQTVQVAQTIFDTQPRYTFESSRDCLKFQEAILGCAIVFTGGVAEITSKVRGDEAISQNLRVCRYSNGRIILLFFANAQKPDRKRYITIPLDAVDSLEVSKKSNKPCKMKFDSSSDMKTQLGVLSVLFLDDEDAKTLRELLKAAGVKILVH